MLSRRPPSSDSVCKPWQESIFPLELIHGTQMTEMITEPMKKNHRVNQILVMVGILYNFNSRYKIATGSTLEDVQKLLVGIANDSLKYLTISNLALLDEGNDEGVTEEFHEEIFELINQLQCDEPDVGIDNLQVVYAKGEHYLWFSKQHDLPIESFLKQYPDALSGCSHNVKMAFASVLATQQRRAQYGMHTREHMSCDEEQSSNPPITTNQITFDSDCWKYANDRVSKSDGCLEDWFQYFSIEMRIRDWAIEHYNTRLHELSSLDEIVASFEPKYVLK